MVYCASQKQHFELCCLHIVGPMVLDRVKHGLPLQPVCSHAVANEWPGVAPVVNTMHVVAPLCPANALSFKPPAVRSSMGSVFCGKFFAHTFLHVEYDFTVES